MDFETLSSRLSKALCQGINLILWILKHNSSLYCFLFASWYKFDPMDFETNFITIILDKYHV